MRKVTQRAVVPLASSALLLAGCSSGGGASQADDPATTESPPETPAATADGTSVDYENRSYTTGCGGTLDGAIVAIPVSGGKGKATYQAPSGGKDKVYLEVQRVVSGQLDGSGAVDAVFLLCYHGNNISAVEMQLFDDAGSFLGSEQPPDLTGNNRYFDHTAVEFTGGVLRTGAEYWATDDCHACGPSQYKVLRWTWDAAERRLAPEVEKRGSMPGGDEVEHAWSEVDVAVEDCDGCTITAYVSREGDEPKRWPSVPVEDGRTLLIVPADDTQSMSFDVSGPKDFGYFNSVPAIALAGRTISGTREANWCWLGATASHTTLTVRHRTVPVPKADRASSGDVAHIFEANPALPVAKGEWHETADGGLGHQDAPYCSV